MHNSSNAHMPKFLLQFQKENKFTVDGVENTYTYDAEKTINYNATNLLVAMGVSLETIEKIRTIMVPGYTAGMEEVEGINKPAQS